VDDCLIFGCSDDVLDTVISDLQKDYVLTSQGSVGTYLGIDIRRTSDGYLELCQLGLINKIITACGLQDQSSNHNTPSTMIRPDIAFAVRQCARFTTAPVEFMNLL